MKKRELDFEKVNLSEIEWFKENLKLSILYLFIFFLSFIWTLLSIVMIENLFINY